MNKSVKQQDFYLFFLLKFTLSLRLLASLVPRVCGVILEASSVQDLTSDQYLGDELMFNMLLLSEVLCVPGKLHIFYLE